MAIYIVRSRTGKNYRRSSTVFMPNRWLAIDTASYGDSGAAILADTRLEAIEITDTEDADLLSSKDIINPEIIPEPEE